LFACMRLGLWKFIGKKSVDQSMFSIDRWMQMHWSVQQTTDRHSYFLTHACRTVVQFDIGPQLQLIFWAQHFAQSMSTSVCVPYIKNS
jgi:hypothetical protein